MNAEAPVEELRFDRVCRLVREKLEADYAEALKGAEWLCGESDNGEDDWELPYFITVYPDPELDTDFYAMCDLEFADEEAQVEFLAEQLLEGLIPYAARRA